MSRAASRAPCATDEDGRLCCPRCDEFYVHHDRVDVFEREEDSATGLHVTVRDGRAGTDVVLAGNPSERRNGVVIALWCENCHQRFRVEMSQHKGITEVFVAWSPGEYFDPSDRHNPFADSTEAVDVTH